MKASKNIPIPPNWDYLTITLPSRTRKGMRSAYAYIVANFLSKFNKLAYEHLNFKSMTAAHKTIGEILNINPNSLKNYRDTFDPIHGFRQGWDKRPISHWRSAQEVKDGFDSYSFEDYYLLVQHILQNPDLTLKEIFDSINGFDSDEYIISPENANHVFKQQDYPSNNDSISDDFTNADMREYQPSIADLRDKKFSQIILRRGQSSFRDKLGQRYNYQCLITECRLFDIVEACHIVPYMGEQDNHPDNGLLMRADLHTLFDLDLLGIEPETLTVKFHPLALQNGYGKLNGARLLCGDKTPSKEALLLRWEKFLKRNENF